MYVYGGMLGNRYVQENSNIHFQIPLVYWIFVPQCALVLLFINLFYMLVIFVNPTFVLGIHYAKH